MSRRESQARWQARQVADLPVTVVPFLAAGHAHREFVDQDLAAVWHYKCARFVRRRLLRRLLQNLVSNAIKYTRSGGLLLALRQHEGVTVLEVWDTGVGIAAAHHQDVFREFYKVPIHSGTEDGFGQGKVLATPLGMASVAQTVANGYIQDYTNAEGAPFQLVSPPVQFGGVPATPKRGPA